MGAGAYKRRFLIQQRAPGVDGDGQPLDDWQDVIKVWGNIRAPSGLGQIAGEFVAAAQEVSRVQYSIRTPYRPGLTAGMRAVGAGVVYEIRQVVHDEARREHTDLVVATGANNG